MITYFKTAMDQIKDVYDKSGDEWTPIAFDIAYEMLCVVPPELHYGDRWACGEAYSINPNGDTVYYCFRSCNRETGTAEGRICTLTELRAA